MALIVGVNTGYTAYSFANNSNRQYLVGQAPITTAAETADLTSFNFRVAAAGLPSNARAYLTDASGNVLWISAEVTVAVGLNTIPIDPPLPVTKGDRVLFGVWCSALFELEADDSGDFWPSFQAATYSAIDEPTQIVTDSGDAKRNGAPLIWAEGVAAPSTTVAGNLQPGASFTLNYSNYDAVPVSPVTITDSNNNSIAVPVTINDNGDGTGTATGTMPSLPGSGTAQGLLFGNVTVELGT